MRVDQSVIKNHATWEEKGYHVPTYDREKMIHKTKEEPVWIHFGAGNIFRAFQANAVEKLLHEGSMDRGIIVVEGYDYEIVQRMYRPRDEITILVTLKADGSVDKTVIGSIAESCLLDREDEKEFERLEELFMKSSLQLATFTITEKGYCYSKQEKEDYIAGPEKATSYMGKVTALLYDRYLAGKMPIAMVSMDNCSHNGEKLYEAVNRFADQWVDHKLVEEGFKAYIQNTDNVSFPWTMIDKITPRPDAMVEELLRNDGVEQMDAVVTSKNTYVAPFVNAEECEYMVIEDCFPNGRPPLEKAGFLFTDRETVERVERMKVCTCLNPLHTALAIFGCLLGYTKISEEMKDPELRKLVEGIGYQEGLPVVDDPGIIDPKTFIDTVLEERISNPFMPDTPQRIATDTSQKLAIRYGETIKNYLAAGKDVAELKRIPLVLAGWIRYLMGVDDEGNGYTLSPDPMLEMVCPCVEGIRLGDEVNVEEVLRPILNQIDIFGVDLYAIGMDQMICEYFTEMIASVGAVRNTLRKYIN